MKTFADFVLAADTAYSPKWLSCFWWVAGGVGLVHRHLRTTHNTSPLSMVFNQSQAIVEARTRFFFNAGSFELLRVCYRHRPDKTIEEVAVVVDSWQTPCVPPSAATLITPSTLICPPPIA